MDRPVEIELEPVERRRRRPARRERDPAETSTGSSAGHRGVSAPVPPDERVPRWGAAGPTARRTLAAFAAVALVATGFVIGRATGPAGEGRAGDDPAGDVPAGEVPAGDGDPANESGDGPVGDTGSGTGGDDDGSDTGEGLADVLGGVGGAIVVDAPMLPVPTGLVVEGLTPDGSLVRIDLDAADVTVVALPLGAAELADGGYLHTLDDVTLVGSRSSARAVVIGRDGTVRPAPSAVTAGGGTAFRGPGPNDVWVYGFGDTLLDARRLLLVDLLGSGDGTTGVTVELDWFDYAVGDGSGGILLHAVGGWFLLDADDGRFVSSGQLIGSGASHLVVVECVSRGDCATVVFDRESGERRSVDGRAVGSGIGFEPASVAPDGSALLSRDRLDDRSPWRLVDLDGGRARTLVSIWGDTGRRGDPGGVAWTDDGRFALLSVRRQLWFHDRETTATRALVPGRILPDVIAFDVRRTRPPAAPRFDQPSAPRVDQRGSSASRARSGAVMSSRGSATMRLR